MYTCTTEMALNTSYVGISRLFYVFFVLFDFGADLCPKLARHELNRDEKRAKTGGGVENIPTV